MCLGLLFGWMKTAGLSLVLITSRVFIVGQAIFLMSFFLLYVDQFSHVHLGVFLLNQQPKIADDVIPRASS